MAAKHHVFETAAARASADPKLRATMRRAGDFLIGLRKKGLAAFADYEGARDAASAARERSLANLPELLERFEEKCAAAGGQVHYAGDAAEARELVVDIARKRGLSRVVKGKSMVTEEIGLNPALEAAGLTVFETDLGEYIVQLAEERPSHILSPALHKSREEVADLFEAKLGRRGQSAPELTRIARQALRREFLAADLGVSGVNMVVAETGTAVLLENEGNIRMAATCPRVHVIVMSLEKVVADFADMAAVMEVLPKSATSQTLPGYLSFLTGPRKPGEADGPEELHVVILDNGRSALLADPILRDCLKCVRCSACLNVCPVYLAAGGHAYGAVYPGPIGSILTPGLSGGAQGTDLPHACTLCGACASVCPTRIDHPRLLLRLRELYAQKAAPAETALLEAHALAAGSPILYRLAAGVLRGLDPELKKAARLPGLGRLARFCRARRLPPLTVSFSRRWKRLARRLKTSRGGHV